MSVLAKLNLEDLALYGEVLAESFIGHCFGPGLPELEGDYLGIDGLKSFFARLSEINCSRFQPKLIDARPVGDELIVIQVCNQLDPERNTDSCVLAPGAERSHDGETIAGWDSCRQARSCHRSGLPAERSSGSAALFRGRKPHGKGRNRGDE